MQAPCLLLLCDSVLQLCWLRRCMAAALPTVFARARPGNGVYQQGSAVRGAVDRAGFGRWKRLSCPHSQPKGPHATLALPLTSLNPAPGDRDCLVRLPRRLFRPPWPKGKRVVALAHALNFRDLPRHWHARFGAASSSNLVSEDEPTSTGFLSLFVHIS